MEDFNQVAHSILLHFTVISIQTLILQFSVKKVPLLVHNEILRYGRYSIVNNFKELESEDTGATVIKSIDLDKGFKAGEFKYKFNLSYITVG